MGIFGALKKRNGYSVETPATGRLVYREGNREYTFPVYQDDDTTVIVGLPSSMRVHLFFNWYPCTRSFTPHDRDRIVPRLAAHLGGEAAGVKVFERGGELPTSFEFYPELFAYRSRAAELLDDAGFDTFSEYGSISLVHEDFGLEIAGIRNDEDVKPILDALRTGFPHWHHHFCCHQDGDIEPGWTVSISLFPPRSCRSGQCEGD